MITVAQQALRKHLYMDLPAYEYFEDEPEDDIIFYVRSPDIFVKRPNWFYMHMLSVKYGLNPHQSEL